MRCTAARSLVLLTRAPLMTSLHSKAMSGKASVNNTYDQEVFTQRAVELISAHGATGPPMFMFLAYHNVHDTCQDPSVDNMRLNAPMGTVERCVGKTLSSENLLEGTGGLVRLLSTALVGCFVLFRRGEGRGN